jgi:pimeloyl-ACP methyl ester carboxylesterase
MSSHILKSLIRSQFGLTPPVLVAHSVSSFVGQKYLESYSLKGLVLVSPVPPSHADAVGRLLKKFNTITADDKGDSQVAMKGYYNLEQEVLDPPEFPAQFMENIIADKNAFLRLEKGK